MVLSSLPSTRMLNLSHLARKVWSQKVCRVWSLALPSSQAPSARTMDCTWGISLSQCRMREISNRKDHSQGPPVEDVEMKTTVGFILFILFILHSFHWMCKDLSDLRNFIPPWLVFGGQHHSSPAECSTMFFINQLSIFFLDRL